MSMYMSPYTEVVFRNPDGSVRYAQMLSDYYKKPDINLQMATYGGSLLDLLMAESYISPDLTLTVINTGNPHADVTRLLGSIAEYLVVDLCNSNPEVNRRLGMYARFGRKMSRTLDDYVAVATGSMRTKNLYPHYYNPSDTQRDIIWVEKDNPEHQLMCLGYKNGASGKPAGLQVKASHNGLQYVVPTILDYHYPVLYFDMSNDWVLVKQAVEERFATARLINPDELHHELKQTLFAYFHILVAYFRGEISIERLINVSRYNGDLVEAGLKAGNLTGASKILLPSR